MNSAFTDTPTSGLDRFYGLELVEMGENRARARVTVRDDLLQPLGGVHGAVYAAIAETLTVIATGRAIAAEGKLATPLSSQLSFLRPTGDGAIHALGVAKHQGRTTWVWEVELSDDRARLCALARITLAVDEASAP